jgi:hypothetical protein
MSSNPTLIAHPACREMAEEMAHAYTDAFEDATGKLPEDRYLQTVAAFALLLSDLDRPASRDAWFRWLSRGRLSDAVVRAYVRDDPAALLAAILEVTGA